MNSMPASSAILASARLSSQLPVQRSGTSVTARPDEQFEPNRPILSALSLYIAMRSRMEMRGSEGSVLMFIDNSQQSRPNYRPIDGSLGSSNRSALRKIKSAGRGRRFDARTWQDRPQQGGFGTMSTNIRRVGIVGLGKMGFPMARHLRKAGFEVAACDVSAAARSAGARRGHQGAGIAGGGRGGIRFRHRRRRLR